MSWLLAFTPALLLGLGLLLLVRRRAELLAHARGRAALVDARTRGSHRARLQHPEIDLAKCIGCGACTRACPEDGVLELLHGQAVVVHGARCVGHGRCAEACPTGAIALTLGDLSERTDLPAVGEDLEAVGVPGLFVAGELSGFALVGTAVRHGAAVAAAVARRAGVARPVPVGVGAVAGARGDGGDGGEGGDRGDVLDLLVVGAGPCGMACTLGAVEHGLSCLTIEQEARLGGSVAGYPRRKLVMTQPMRLPLHGLLKRLSYQKEELVELWERLARQHRLPVRTGVQLLSLDRDADGTFAARTSAGTFHARNVCLALGRRGTPRRLGVPGEDLPKVAYSLLDAASYQGRRVLVVGGGDSAVEAALALAQQPGNEVALSYRKPAFFRLKARNDAAIEAARAAGTIRFLLPSTVASIEADAVELATGGLETGEPESGEGAARLRLPNDEVFVFAGGTPPFGLLRDAGVSFDPAARPLPATAIERDRSLLWALAAVLVAALALGVWTAAHRDYYFLPLAERRAAPLHEMLRPSGPVGLPLGLLACALFTCNLAYLVRRARGIGRLLPGSLRLWMGAHVFTGLLALLCVLGHAGLAAGDTVGGHALLALGVVVATGAIGRYLYAFVPRAANGRQADLLELHGRVAAISAEWDRSASGFAAEVRRRVEGSIGAGRWGHGFARRVCGLLRAAWRLRADLRGLRDMGRRQGIPEREVQQLLALARRAHRLALAVAHFEEVRAVLSSWRYFHRWLALLMVLLAAVHVVTAVRFGAIDWSVLGRLLPGGGP